jgi:ketopantoate reductase
MDTTSGLVVEKGEKFGIATPHREMVAVLIHTLENRNRTQGEI